MIFNYQSINEFLEDVRSSSKRIGLCHGTFDLIHPGHLEHITECKKNCDVLVISITPDKFINKGPNRPVYNEIQRANFLSSIKYIDAVIIAPSSTGIEVINSVQPNFYFKGIDYLNESEDLTGNIKLERDATESFGGKVFITKTTKMSSSEIIRQNKLEGFSPEFEAWVDDLKGNTSLDEINHYIEEVFPSLSISVVGDLIVDQYNYVEPVGTTSKSPTISSLFKTSELMLGGSACIARHLSSFCEEVNYSFVKGNLNWSFDDLFDALPENINLYPIEDNQSYTNKKVRFMGGSYPNTLLEKSESDKKSFPPSKLFEYAYLGEQQNLFQENQDNPDLLKKLLSSIAESDALIWSDFGHGMLDNNLWKLFSASAKKTILNVQTNSTNFGFNFATKYSGSDLLVLDELELRLPLSDRTSELATILDTVNRKFNASEIIVTQGAAGMSFIESNEIMSCPSIPANVLDPVGAGDAVLAIAALCKSSNAPKYVTHILLAVAGYLACQIVGNRDSLDKNTMIKVISNLL